MKKNLFPKVALLCAASYALNAFAIDANGQLMVVFKVNKTCSVTSTTKVHLGALDSTSNEVAEGMGDVTVKCSNKIPYKIGLLPSSGATDGTGTMRAKNVHPMVGNVDTIAYALFSDTSMASAWGTIGNIPQDTGNSQDKKHTVYGKVTGSVNVTPDEYEDQVSVIVTY